MTPEAALLATGSRGTAPELVVRGHVAVVDASGRLVAAAGDPAARTTARSCVKPLQVLPFVRSAMAPIGAGDEDLAVACSSHQGEPGHVAAVRHLLSTAAVPESALACGPQLPFNSEAARRVLIEEGGPSAIHNNCSGKHAAMLATCRVMGWPLDGYRAPGHPCQVAVTAAMGGFMDLDLAAEPWGVDGCGLPTYGVELQRLATGFARAQSDPGFDRARAAMAAAPFLVAGTGKFDTALLTATGGRVTGKSGGAAVWAASADGGLGIAIKLEAGAGEALPAVALAVLRTLGLVTPAETLDEFAEPPIHNWEGTVVGSITAMPPAL